MTPTTPEEYHEDDELHGGYQYLTLKQIIDDFMVDLTDDDHILKNTKRAIILKHAKSGIRTLNRQVFNDIKTMEITVPEFLYFALPHDYVDYLRVSLVVTDASTNSLRLQPLNINSNINVADGYLQDDIGYILFDEDGYILQADSQNHYNKPYKRYEFSESYCQGGSPNLDTSKLSKYGEFKIDEANGKIVFSSNLDDQEIVMEYLSDGLSPDQYNDGQIKVHKNCVDVLNDWIYYKCIQRKKNIPRGEKIDALNRFKTTRHEAKLERANFDLFQIERTMRLSSRNI